MPLAATAIRFAALRSARVSFAMATRWLVGLGATATPELDGAAPPHHVVTVCHPALQPRRAAPDAEALGRASVGDGPGTDGTGQTAGDADRPPLATVRSAGIFGEKVESYF